MIAHDDDNEEVLYKVADKRKFNADGSLRDGVTLEPAKPAQPPAEEAVVTAKEEGFADGTAGFDDAEDNLDEIPGAHDPASFVNFLSSLATNAAAALGAVPHPDKGQRSLDLVSGKYWLDIISMLRDKTKNNLHPQESRLLEGLLADLRMQYVHLVRASDEKLKAQAAPNISGADILGKK